MINSLETKSILNQEHYFNTNDVLPVAIDALKFSISSGQATDFVNLLRHIFYLIKPENESHVLSVSRETLRDIFTLSTIAFKSLRNDLYIPDLDQILFSKSLLSIHLVEPSSELIDHLGYHGTVIKQQILKLAHELNGSLFPIENFVKNYVKFILKKTQKHYGNGKVIYLIRDSLSMGPTKKPDGSLDSFFLLVCQSTRSPVINARFKIKMKNGVVHCLAFKRKEQASSKQSIVTCKSIDTLLKSRLKKIDAIPACKLTPVEQDLYIGMNLLHYLLMDPYKKSSFVQPIIDTQGNTFSSASIRGDLRIANHEVMGNHFHRPNKLIEKLMILLNQEIEFLENLFRDLFDLLKNPITDHLIENPVVTLDGNTHDKSLCNGMKHLIPNKKIEEVLIVLKKYGHF